MDSSQQLRRTLTRIDGRGYRAYKQIQGCYSFPRYRLSVDHVQGDPFAAPSRVSLQISLSDLGLPTSYAENRYRQIAAADFLGRRFADCCSRLAPRRQGTGGSGRIEIDSGGQQILERNAVLLTPELVEVRFTIGLPAAGRRILAESAQTLFFKAVPQIVEQALVYSNLPARDLALHVDTYQDQQALRAQLRDQNLVAFVANGAILPRRSGIDDRPMDPASVVAFHSPPELQCCLMRPQLGPVEGMGIPHGVHLIVGGGFHGKSTLLRGLERGVYNHIPGDGREWVLADSTAAKIRAEDGRYITSVNISPFINNLPMGRDTTRFSTENASGSTSQAANIMEALEAGSKVLLIDEDTSASNFMLRDARMQRLISKDKEPITPLIDRVSELFERHGVSTLLVTGGSGDYFDVAHRVVQMEDYRPREVTAQVQAIVAAHPSQRRPEAPGEFTEVPHRAFNPASFDPRRGRRSARIDVRGRERIVFGRWEIDLAQVEQLVDRSQTRAIGLALHYLATRLLSPQRPLRDCLFELEQLLDRKGLDLLSPFKVGHLARPRALEVAAAMNRLRSARAELLPHSD